MYRNNNSETKKQRKAKTSYCKERVQRRLADRMPLFFSLVHYLSSEKGEMEWGRDKLGFGDQQIQTTIYKIDEQNPTYSTGNYIQYFTIHQNGKESENSLFI